MALTQVIILLTAILLAHRGMGRFYANHWPAIVWIVTGFAGYFLLSLIRVLFDTQSVHWLDGPSRLLFGLSCIGFVGFLKPSIRSFWLGICLAAIVAGIIALVQCGWLGMERAEGFTSHAITYGDLALATGLLALCGWPEFRKSKISWLPWVAFAFALIASILSGSRGGWVALPFAVIPLLRHHRIRYQKALLYGVLSTVALIVLLLLEKNSTAAQRIAMVFSDVHGYYANNQVATSVGTRLELWKASWMMFSDHPLLGVGRGVFQESLYALLHQGRLQESMALAYSSSHNDALHFLATGGLVDFSFLLLMYFAPLAFFTKALRSDNTELHSPALGGVVLVICFMIFGLTDVMFWLMVPKSFYVMMLCILVGFCLTGKSTTTANGQPA
ncbi:O-antigen ligase family protein [Janthinobacterium agaricidamnosum]|nr:O-antigen ligase family protein [Janthinobacterium agaricidamnosum]